MAWSYYNIDFSGTNRTAPKKEELDALRLAGVELSHEYGMSQSAHPDAPLDLYMNARTKLSEEAFYLAINKFSYRPLVTRDSPSRVTIRKTTVEQEFNKNP
jgi:hypothetical protein